MKFLRYFQPSLQFDSFSEALRACDGYENQDLVRVVHEKTKRLNGNSSFPALPGPNVLDFGGACGAHYFAARSQRSDLRWHVVETPAMVRAAKDLEDGHLRFFDNMTEAKRELGNIDVLFSSGALQYVPEPYAVLEELLSLGARTVIIARLPLKRREKISIQVSKLSENGPGPLPEGCEDGNVRYPITFMCRDKFERIIARHYGIKEVKRDSPGFMYILRVA